MVFIDGSNAYHIIKRLVPDRNPGDFNFEKLIKYLIKDKKLITIYYYNCPLDRTKNLKLYISQQRFFEKLRRISNFKLVLCRMQKVKIHGRIEYRVKEDDIHLAVDMVKLAYKNSYDTVILISSDGDFVPAVKAVQEKGKKVENIGFENKFSYHLKQECDKFRKINKETCIKFFDEK